MSTKHIKTIIEITIAIVAVILIFLIFNLIFDSFTNIYQEGRIRTSNIGLINLKSLDLKLKLPTRFKDFFYWKGLANLSITLHTLIHFKNIINHFINLEGKGNELLITIVREFRRYSKGLFFFSFLYLGIFIPKHNMIKINPISILPLMTISVFIYIVSNLSINLIGGRSEKV